MRPGQPLYIIYRNGIVQGIIGSEQAAFKLCKENNRRDYRYTYGFDPPSDSLAFPIEWSYTRHRFNLLRRN